MEDKQMRRAGLDYHEYAPVRRHASWDAFVADAEEREGGEEVRLGLGAPHAPAALAAAQGRRVDRRGRVEGERLAGAEDDEGEAEARDAGHGRSRGGVGCA